MTDSLQPSSLESNGGPRLIDSEQVAVVHLTNDLAVLRCAVANRGWLIIEDPEIEAAFELLARKAFETTERLNAISAVWYGRRPVRE